MKVLSLLLRNSGHRRCRKGGRIGLNESPELIAQEFGSGRRIVIGDDRLNESPELIAQECLVDVASRADRLASMKVLSLLLRNIKIVFWRNRVQLASMKVLSLLLRNT